MLPSTRGDGARHDRALGISPHTAPPAPLLLMDDHVERRNNRAHYAVHRPPPARPLRGGVAPGCDAPAGPPPPLRVYCVEPRDFRELVQRLTGAGTTAPAPAPGHPARVITHTPSTGVSQNSGRVEAAAGQFDYSPWLSAPLFSPAAYNAPAGFDGNQGLV